MEPMGKAELVLSSTSPAVVVLPGFQPSPRIPEPML